MSDNNGGGLLSSLVAGAALTTVLLAPFYIAYRFGLHVLAFIAAILATIYAIFSPQLVAMANEMQDCGYRCMGAAGAQAILDLDKIGWWWIAGMMWAIFGLSVLARAMQGGADVEGS